MFILELKPKEELLPLLKGKTLFIRCEGCREVFVPEDDIEKFKEELKNSGGVFEEIVLDYLCNEEYTEKRALEHKNKIDTSDSVVILSCGAGVQVAANYINKALQSGCNTLYISGFQGLTPSKFDCAQCGNCLLNYTGAICPLTACAKGLVNGPCGGAKNGKCEIDPEKDCGWEKILNALAKHNNLHLLKAIPPYRDYALLYQKKTAEAPAK